VVHYDLSWNPTRHEQRAGRVDRYGQPRKTVRVLTYYGTDNQIDGIVLEVLLRKHRAIRSSLGISIPVPADANAVVEAILEGLLLSRDPDAGLEQLSMFEAYLKPRQEALFGEWEEAAEREKRSRTIFAQESIKVDQVARELAAVGAAIGSGADVAGFVRSSIQAHGGTAAGDGALRLDLAEAPAALRDAVGGRELLRARFELPVSGDELYLTRTHPVVEGLASYVFESALDPIGHGAARRCGAIRTAAVMRRTTLLLVRYRFHLIVERAGADHPLLAEECGLLTFAGAPEAPDWLSPESAEALLSAEPSGNVSPEQAVSFVGQVIAGFGQLAARLDQEAGRRAAK
ncbi:MAG: helicase-related protein, partial [Acidimicrobiales bacterium]